jgi:hypothetical protein
MRDDVTVHELYRAPEMIDERRRRMRFTLLIGGHFLLGVVLSIVGVAFRKQSWPTVLEFVYAGFLASEVLLLGMWVGLGGSGRWTRLFGLVLGITWLCVLFLARIDPQRFRPELPEISLVLSLCTIGVSGIFILGRRLIGRIECRTEWPSHSKAKDLQFNLKSLLWLTALIGALLTMGEIIRSWRSDSGIFLLPLVFALWAVLTAWLVVCAGLGCQGWMRVPFTLSGVALVGLLPPYYLTEGTSVRQWIAWPVMGLTTAVWTLISLYVIRSCGYRLVRASTTPTQQ